MGRKFAIAALGAAVLCACGGSADSEGNIGPGPWPNVPYKDYSRDYGIDWVQSAGVDEAHNIWLLRDREIGVLRPGTSTPVWASKLGQASSPFGRGAPALGSTVICGGEEGRAYVGYRTYELPQPQRKSPDDPEYRKGDLDVVRLRDDDRIVLEAHLGQTTDRSGYAQLGIRNSNDWHYDEDRSVLTCQRVMRGRDKGDLYVGTNHGVTRIRGLVYSSHRHSVWEIGGALRIGYNYGLGIGQNGDVLMANEWKVAIVEPPDALEDFADSGRAPWKLDTWARELNSLAEMDYWRAFQQAKDGRYWLGSEGFGLWRMERTGSSVGDARFERVAGLPSNYVLALAAANDGSLYIGTGDAGLWRMRPSGTIEPIPEVTGRRVTQLVYDPTVKPGMLYVVADAMLSVVRD
ncbi:MAG TPA: two-component regulator propeller domain-containing protein [Myxococcaceae bacterium]|nr:two-component regulator propeller domain-containing protein [Myxococcaceae bacterium]